MGLFHLFVAPRHRAGRMRLAFIIYLAVLVFGSVPGAREEVGHLASGIVLHFSAYSCVAALLFSGMATRPAARAFRTCIIIAAMGALDEFVQSFFPYRTADILDWYVDVAAGMFTAGVLWAYFPGWQASLEERR